MNLGRRVALWTVRGDVTLLAAILADDHSNFGSTGDRTRRRGVFRWRVSLRLTRRRRRRGSVLGKDERFIRLGRRLLTRRGSGRPTGGTGWVIDPTVKHGEALVGRLGIKIVAERELVGQFSTESAVSVPVRPAKHERSKKLLPYRRVGYGEFGGRGRGRIDASPGSMHVM